MADKMELGAAPGLKTASSAAPDSATPEAIASEDQQGIRTVSRLTGDILKVEGSIPPPVKGANR
jgi:hypothetical protein